jgi:hypothetical protein
MITSKQLGWIFAVETVGVPGEGIAIRPAVP